MSLAESLVAVIARSLAPWKLISASRASTALLIECRDEGGRIHVLECAHRGVGAALVVSERLQLGYRTAPVDPAPVESYVAIFERLLAHETALVEELARVPVPVASPLPPPRPTGPVVYVTEHALARAFAAARLRRRTVHDVARELFAQWFPRSDGELHLYLEARCAQHCEFCEEAENRDRAPRRALTVVHESLARVGIDLVESGALDALLDRAAASSVGVMITGHDFLRHPRVDEILSSLERHPSVAKTFQGPFTGVGRSPRFERLASLAGLRAVRTTLQSINESEHDAMVGRPGAARELLTLIDRLTDRGLRVDLTTVLTRRALSSLPATVQWIAARGLSVTLHAFIPDRGMSSAAAALAPLDDLRAALAALKPPSAIVSIVGVPVCALPAELAPKLERAWENPERGEVLFADACLACESRAACSGVPATYLRAFGARGLVPQYAPAPGGRAVASHTS